VALPKFGTLQSATLTGDDGRGADLMVRVLNSQEGEVASRVRFDGFAEELVLTSPEDRLSSETRASTAMPDPASYYIGEIAYGSLPLPYQGELAYDPAPLPRPLIEPTGRIVPVTPTSSSDDGTLAAISRVAGLIGMAAIAAVFLLRRRRNVPSEPEAESSG
jgi:MYXO-CTERM domain-containing protein